LRPITDADWRLIRTRAARRVNKARDYNRYGEESLGPQRIIRLTSTYRYNLHLGDKRCASGKSSSAAPGSKRF
jgi:hypothetical protein